ncbi:MAG: hypothetical protein Q7S51_12235 [Gallionellaceae bacterium]|nr:hypothetical protein [Gallionellaceae bacterium]
MWADVSADGTVVMGFRFPGNSEVELVLDKDIGEISPPQLITTQVVGALKLSFHATGQYKLTAPMGKSLDSMDRATVVGPKLSYIDKPRRMAEILLPLDLPVATKQITENDILLETTTAPPGPLRCVISCMSKNYFEQIVAEKARFVDTSIWECVHALETGEQVWSWVMRRSMNDTEYPNRFLVFLAGDVKWGQQ